MGFKKGHKAFKGTEKTFFKKGQLPWNAGSALKEQRLCRNSLCSKSFVCHPNSSRIFCSLECSRERPVWNKGKRGYKLNLSEESRQKRSLSRKGKSLSKEICRKISDGRKGMKFSEEHKKNISRSNKGKPKPRVALANKGKHYSVKTEFKKGMVSWNTGKSNKVISKCLSCEKDILDHPSRKKRFCDRRCFYLFFRGAKHPHWKGGVAYNLVRNKRIRENGGKHTLGEWETLKARYNWTCPCCKKVLELVKDHIIPLAKGGSSNIENIQPLCRSCNAKKHTNTTKYDN
jgi:5-methylcytosine-specific restriction endonuclease McrA